MLTADTRPVRQHGGFADLSDRTKLRLTGADRVRYLNGQVTANVTRLKPGESVPACVTTAKGKLCAEVFITATSDALIIDAEPDLRETLHGRLERYIISDDAALEDVTDSLALLHRLPGAGEAAGAAVAGSETGKGAVATAMAKRFGIAGRDVFVPVSELSAWYEKLSAGWDDEARGPIAPEVLEVLRIESGVPRWGAELDEDTLPPEAGLDRTHVDYHKGCYIGQEVISRLKSVGHVNRRLVGLEVAEGTEATEGTAAATAVGTQLFEAAAAAPVEESVAPNNDSGAHVGGFIPAKPLGRITSVARSLALGRTIALGYVRRGAPDRLRAEPEGAAAGSGCVVAVRELPFFSVQSEK